MKIFGEIVLNWVTTMERGIACKRRDLDDIQDSLMDHLRGIMVVLCTHDTLLKSCEGYRDYLYTYESIYEPMSGMGYCDDYADEEHPYAKIKGLLSSNGEAGNISACEEISNLPEHVSKFIKEVSESQKEGAR